MSTMTDDLGAALAGFEKLIEAQVSARVEAELAKARADTQRVTDNAVKTALDEQRSYIVQAISLLESAVGK